MAKAMCTGSGTKEFQERLSNFFIANRTTQDGKKYSNLAFPIYLPGDSKFNIVGLEERGRVKADEISGYKGKAPGSNSSEGLWIANLSGKSLDRAEKIMWFESAFDAMAYHQLYREDKCKTKAEGKNMAQKNKITFSKIDYSYNYTYSLRNNSCNGKT